MELHKDPEMKDFLELLETICKSAAELLGASASSVYLKEGDHVIMRAAYGYSDTLVHKAKYKIGEGITGWIATNKEFLANSKKEIDEHPNHLGLYDKEIWKECPKDCNSIIGVPLVINSEVYGLIKVENKCKGKSCIAFTQEDLKRLKVFLNAISYTIQQNKAVMSILGKFFVFVLMPFKDKFENIYDCILQAAELQGMKCAKMNDLQVIGKISSAIYDSIERADIIVALMTDKNPNVFYETGYCHALNKPTIHLSSNAKDIPFDLKDYNHIIYDPVKLPELRNELIKYFEHAKEKVLQISDRRDRITTGWYGPGSLYANNNASLQNKDSAGVAQPLGCNKLARMKKESPRKRKKIIERMARKK
jgi:transcriptional regulator with GAF, ATPase, and Fis domain